MRIADYGMIIFSVFSVLGSWKLPQHQKLEQAVQQANTAIESFEEVAHHCPEAMPHADPLAADFWGNRCTREVAFLYEPVLLAYQACMQDGYSRATSCLIEENGCDSSCRPNLGHCWEITALEDFEEAVSHCS